MFSILCLYVGLSSKKKWTFLSFWQCWRFSFNNSGSSFIYDNQFGKQKFFFYLKNLKTKIRQSVNFTCDKNLSLGLLGLEHNLSFSILKSWIIVCTNTPQLVSKLLSKIDLDSAALLNHNDKRKVSKSKKYFDSISPTSKRCNFIILISMISVIIDLNSK